MDRGFRPGPRLRETGPGLAVGTVFLPLEDFNLLVSGSPWPMKRAVAPCVSPSSASTGGVGPGGIPWGGRGLVVSPSAVRIWSWSCNGRGGASEKTPTNLKSLAKERRVPTDWRGSMKNDAG